MIELIVTGHGHFASGIMSSLELIAGKQEGIHSVDFISDMNQDDVKKEIESLVKDLDKVIILCDLLGGTPFKMASLVMKENSHKNIEVVSGTNLAMLMEASFTRANSDCVSLVDIIVAAGQQGIINAKQLFLNQSNNEEIESGF